ncbi:MAG: hypothetical protein ACYC2G_09540 [Gemmatimonadaceae bacterium]
MIRRLTPIVLLALGAACAGGRAAPAPSPAPAPAAADSTSGPDAPGARWYGYEGGLKDAEASARAIEGAGQYWTEREGNWRTDSASGTFTAFDDGKWVRRLEVATHSGPRRGTGAFTYDERGRLYYFGGEWRVRVGRGRRARTDRVVVSVALNRAGSVGAARKTVNGRAQPLSAGEVEWILALERAVRDRAGS